MKKNNFLIALALYIGLSSGTSFCAQPSRFSWVTQSVSSLWQTVKSPFNPLMEKMQGWSTQRLLLVAGAVLTVLVGIGIISRTTTVGTLITKTEEPKSREHILGMVDETIQGPNNNLLPGINESTVSQAATNICQRTKKLVEDGGLVALTNLDNKIKDKIESVEDGEQKDRYIILQELFKNAHEYLAVHRSDPSFNLNDMKAAIISEKVNALIEEASKKYPADEQEEATFFEKQERELTPEMITKLNDIIEHLDEIVQLKPRDMNNIAQNLLFEATTLLQQKGLIAVRDLENRLASLIRATKNQEQKERYQILKKMTHIAYKSLSPFSINSNAPITDFANTRNQITANFANIVNAMVNYNSQ